MSDGPNGLRYEVKREGSNVETMKATCFPSACLAACSFDIELLAEMGKAMASEARAKDVNLILGPSVNIKRNPLCGRNFEYFSEDPLLAGEMAGALINGLQSNGVGATLKHYALNNQEKARTSSDSIADERAKREIYLAAFETAIKIGNPWAIMTSYNKADGVYAGESKPLLNILRQGFGYDGLVMSDWGAVCDRVAGIKAGQDLEMPGDSGFRAGIIEDAIECGELEISCLDKACGHVLELGEKAMDARERFPFGISADEEANHLLSRRIAAESIVLLKNGEHLLPFEGCGKVAVIGEFARTPRYQGGGASNIHPLKLPSFLEELGSNEINYDFAPGYAIDSEELDDALIRQAVELSGKADAVIALVGLPNSYESEGYDRPHMRLPQNQLAMVKALASANPRIAVAIFAGGPVELPFLDDVKAVLMCYLPGQAGAGALVDIVFGKACPSGKLAESFPKRYEDVPSHAFFGSEDVVEYRESVFVGYRYFLSAGVETSFPFGHGLSYTSFEYSSLELRKPGKAGLDVSLKVKNVGKVKGAEVCQLYASPPQSAVFRPSIELKAFKKVLLEPGEESHIEFHLDDRAFSVWNTISNDWQVVPGEYRIMAGSSSEDIRLSQSVCI
jgi:beta-glucosidase